MNYKIIPNSPRRPELINAFLHKKAISLTVLPEGAENIFSFQEEIKVKIRSLESVHPNGRIFQLLGIDEINQVSVSALYNTDTETGELKTTPLGPTDDLKSGSNTEG